VTPENRRIGGLLRVTRIGPNRFSIDAHLSGYIFLDPDTGLWVAYCRELDISSCGEDADKALKNIQEAQELFFQSCLDRGVLDKALAELNWVCGTPGDEILACDEDTLPEVPPAFMVADIMRRGLEWSNAISWTG